MYAYFLYITACKHILEFLYFMIWTNVFIFCACYDIWGYSTLVVMIMMILKAPVNQKHQDPPVLNSMNGDSS